MFVHPSLMCGSGISQNFIGTHSLPIFLISDFNILRRNLYEIWQQLVTPWPKVMCY